MDKFITIRTFTHPTELAILRGRLELEGIEYFIQDELSVQIRPGYSNAIGGVKLQVKESDIEKTLEILKSGGFIKDEEPILSSLYTKIDKATFKIPFLKKLRFEYRLMIIAPIVIWLVVGAIFMATLPTTSEKLIKQSWCVDGVTYDGRKFKATTVDFIQLVGAGICEESIVFEKDGIVTLPGFNSHGAIGSWKINNNSLQIMQADTFDFLYNGVYEIDFIDNKLILKSKQTSIYCHPENIHINLPF